MKLTNNIKTLAAVAGLALAAGSANAAIALLEDFEGATTNVDYANTMYTGNSDSTIDLNGIANSPSDSGDNTTQTAFQRSSNRLLTLDNPLALDSGAYTSFTVALDYYYNNYSSAAGTRLEYSALGDFSDSQNVMTWASNGTPNNLWTAGSVTLNEGTYTFTDTAKIRFRSGGFANSTHGYLDNIAITAGVVPEPSTTALLGLGGLALILRRRK
jgi:hypothetical protein